MKLRVFFASFAVFIILSSVFYILSETLTFVRLRTDTANAEQHFLSVAETAAPEVKAAFNKSDDIAMLYSIERISRLNGAAEVFIINKNNEIVIHNDSSKWDKKYTDDVYKNIINSSDKLMQNIPLSSYVIYSVPVSSDNFLCIVFSVENIKSAVNSFRIKLFVISGFISVFITVMVYFILKFFFLSPYDKTIKLLSVNNTEINTVYKNMTDMIRNNILNNSADSDCKIKDGGTKLLFNSVCKYFIEKYENFDVFAVIDSYAKVIVCIDKDNIIFNDNSENKHIINAVKNTEIIKNISTLIEKESGFENIEVIFKNIKTEIIPVLNEDKKLAGMAVTAEIIK